jgi:uncharacterized membrane protein YfcA
LPSLDATEIAIACAAALVLGVMKTSVGGGIGLTLTPVLALIMPPSAVLGLMGCFMVLSDPMGLYLYWRQWDARHLRLILPAALAGIALGAWLLAGLSEDGLRRLIGAAALVMAGLSLVSVLRVPRGYTRASVPAGLAVGLGTGIASVVANSGGIILGPYLAGLGMGSAAVLGTFQAVVVGANLLKLAAYRAIGFITLRIALLALLTTPLLYLGSLVGYRLNARIPRRALALTLIAIAIAGGVKLLAG